MKKTVLSSLALAASSTIAFASAGLFDSFAIVNTTGDQFYDAGATTGLPDFQGTDLGDFEAGTDTLQLGGQTKTFKNSSSDVTGASLFYRIWSGSESGSFSELSYAFQINDVGGTPGDQQWGTDASGINASAFYTADLISGLSAGDYTLEVYTRITTNGVDAPAEMFANNGGANYEATFTVVPEPGSFALLAGLSGLAFLALRRR
ncbi:MAG: PEP-CTERM sorting domain-containing protein [Coraliomargarita sp.]